VAASIGKAAFFAPEQEMEPDNLLPPIIFNFSIIYTISEGVFVVRLNAWTSPD
jgi:hypothetical protein